MKKIKNKKIVSIMLVLGMLSGVGMVSRAAGTSAATKNSLRSQGAVRYQDGEESVVIDSADLYTLADKLDLFKVRTAQQLGEIGTYLSKDTKGTPLTSENGIYAAHQKPSSSDEADPLSLSFETILEGIAVSQTIPTDPTAYGTSAGTTLYQGTDGKLSSEAQEGSKPIESIRAATAENLSAGTAAWVDGHLILGTGGDNKAYYEKGTEISNTGSDTSTSLNRMECIRMNTPGNVYVVPENMNDVILVFFGSSNFQLSFASSEIVTYKEILKKSYYYQGYENMCCTMYFIPELKKGTGINIWDSDCYLLHIKDPNKKSGKITVVPLSETSYYVPDDRKDVLLLQYDTVKSIEDPAFQEAVGDPLVAFKPLASFSRRYSVNLSCSYGLYYIPELKAETVISEHKNGVLFY